MLVFISSCFVMAGNLAFFTDPFLAFIILPRAYMKSSQLIIVDLRGSVLLPGDVTGK